MEMTYRTENGYQLPNLEAPEAPNVGKYGMLRRSYLQKYKTGIYTGMQLSGKLDNHLQEINQKANEMVESLSEQMAAEQGVNEALKAVDPLTWVGRMNNIKAAAEEIVMEELIYS